MDLLVQGIAAFLLGVCYEFNRETGEVGRYAICRLPVRHIDAYRAFAALQLPNCRMYSLCTLGRYRGH